MSSANSTEVEKTEDSSPVYEFEKSLSDSISKKFPNIEIVYVKQNRIRVNVKTVSYTHLTLPTKA